MIAHLELEGLEAKLAIAGNGNNSSYSKKDVNAFDARAKALQKSSGFTASQVRNGEQFLDRLKEAMTKEGSVGTVVVFAHSSQDGVYLDKEDGFYRGDVPHVGQNSTTVGDLKEAVSNGDVKFDENAVIILGGCNCGKNDGEDPLSVSLTKELGVTTIAATGAVYPEVVDGKETGRLKTDGSFIQTEKKYTERTFEIPGYGSLTVTSTIAETNLGKTIDPAKLGHTK